MSKTDQPTGNGKGRGESPDSLHTMSASEMVIVQRAFVERWPMDPEYRQRAVNRVMEAIDAKDSTQRQINAAARTLAVIDRLNILENQQEEAGGFLEGLIGEGGQVNVQLIVNQLRADPDWAEFARAKMLEEAAEVAAHSTNGNGRPAK